MCPASLKANGRHSSLQELGIDLIVMARYMQVRQEAEVKSCCTCKMEVHCNGHLQLGQQQQQQPWLHAQSSLNFGHRRS